MNLTIRRFSQRLFYCLISLLLAAHIARATGPATTTVTDVVYRADGSAASGTLLISWPAFVTSDGKAVAAGSMSLTIGAGGVVTVALAPNDGASPAGTYYTVVYKLDDQTTSTEYWLVPAASPTTIAAIRSIIVPQTVAAQFASKSYVDSAVAPKASDSAVIHIAGSESVTGVKTFTVPPAVPTPVNPTDAANKSYVDSVAGSGGGGGSAGTGSCTASNYVYAVNPSAPPSCRSVGAIRFADQYASIQAAITDAGTSGSVVIPASYSGSDSYTNPNNINIQDLRGAPDRYKGFVNVVTDCGATGDGVTDDGPAIQNCLNANPGRHIFFPKMCASQSGGNSFSCIDFRSSQTLTLSGNGQWLEGELQDTWQGAPVIWFFNDVTGVVVPTTVYGARVSNLELIGSPWPPNGVGTYACAQFSPIQNLRPPGASDGIFIQGGEFTLENVQPTCFTRHGVNLDGGAGTPDTWTMINVFAVNNYGDGIFIHGGDSSAGANIHPHVAVNGGWGIRDNASFGDTILQPHADGNHKSLISAGSPIGTSSVSRATHVVSVTTSSANSYVLGTWITLSGCSDSTFNGTFKISTLTDSTHFAFNDVGANGSATGCAVNSASSAEVYDDPGTGFVSTSFNTLAKCTIAAGSNQLACADGSFYDDHQPGMPIYIAGAGSSGSVLSTTIVSVNNGSNAVLATNAITSVVNAKATYGGGWGGGPYNSTGQSTWLSPYAESNEPKMSLGSGNILINGNGPTTLVNYGYVNGVPTVIAPNGITSANPLTFTVPVNGAGNLIQLKSGSTSDGAEGVQLQDHNGNLKIGVQWDGGSNFNITDFTHGGGTNFFNQVLNGALSISSSGTTSPLNLQANSTGDINFFGLCASSIASCIKSSGTFYQGSTGVPSVVMNTPGLLGAFYSPASSTVAFGFGGTATTNPASATFTIPQTGNAVFANGVTVPSMILSGSTAHGVLLGEASSSLASTSAGTSGQCLLSNGASSDPSFQNCPGGSSGVTQVNTGAGLTGGPITTTGTIAAAINLCTDYPAPGALSVTWTAGHTYCFGAGTYTISAAQSVNVNDVTILGTTTAAIIQRTGATDGFDLSGNNDRILGPLTLDGASQSGSGTGPLVKMTGNDGLIDGVTITNPGVSNPASANGVLIATGSRNAIKNVHVPLSNDTTLAITPSASATVTDAAIVGNRIDNCTGASAITISCIKNYQPTGTNNYRARVENNWVYGSSGTGPATVVLYDIGYQVAPTNTSVGLMFRGNHAVALAALNPGGLMKLFGLFFGSVENNVADDGGFVMSNAAINMGDVYGSAVAGNQMRALNGIETGMQCADCTRNSFANNQVDGPSGSSHRGFVLSTAANPSNFNSISGNVVRLGATATNCYLFSADATHAISDNDFSGNVCTGQGSNVSTGFAFATAGAAVSNNRIGSNTWQNLATGISIPSGVTSTLVDTQEFDSVTTPLTDAGTSTQMMSPIFAPLVNTTAVTANAAVSTDQNLMTVAIPAQGMNVANKTFTLRGSGTWSTGASGAGTMTFKLKACTVSGCGSGTVVTLATLGPTATQTSSVTSAGWIIEGSCSTVATGATGTLTCDAELKTVNSATVTSAGIVHLASITATATVDLTVAENLQLTIADSGSNANNTFTQRRMFVKSEN